MEKTKKGKLFLVFTYSINFIILFGIIMSNHSVIIVEERDVSGFFREDYYLSPKNTVMIHISPMIYGQSPDKIILNISTPELGIQKSFSISYSVDGWGGGSYSNVDLGTTYNHYSFENPTNQRVLYEITLEPDDLNNYKVIILLNSLQSGLEIFVFSLMAIISMAIHLTVIIAYIDKKTRLKFFQYFLKDANNKKHGHYYLLLSMMFLLFSLYALLGIIFVYT